MNERSYSPASLQKCILGTAALGGVWGRVDPESSVRTILEALEKGVTAIDTAPAYGDAETFTGQALQQWRGAFPQLSTKVGRLKSYAADECYYDFTPSGLERSLEQSLITLGVSKIDVLLLHEPATVPMHQLEAAIEKMVWFKENGFAQKIGLGGNIGRRFQEYIDAGLFDVLMEYNRLNACNIDALHTTLEDTQDRGMEFWAASPLHMGLLGGRFQEFTGSRPQWLEQRCVDIAQDVNKIADACGLLLSVLALRFLHNVKATFKIVIGPANSKELESCLVGISDQPLDNLTYEKILRVIEQRNHPGIRQQ